MTTATEAKVNAGLQAEFEGVLNFGAELEVFQKAVSMLNSGEISVRDLKATIEAAIEKGSLPTIKPSSAQYFVNTSKVRALKGGEDKPLKEAFATTIQAKRAFGKDFEAKLSEAKNYAEFRGEIPSQGERAKAGRKASAKVEAVTADAVISLAFGLWKELDTHDIKDIETAQKFAEQLVKAITYNKRKNHPTSAKVA